MAQGNATCNYLFISKLKTQHEIQMHPNYQKYLQPNYHIPQLERKIIGKESDNLELYVTAAYSLNFYNGFRLFTPCHFVQKTKKIFYRVTFCRSQTPITMPKSH